MSADTDHLEGEDRQPLIGANEARGWTGDTSWATDGRLVGGCVLLASLVFLWRLGGLAGVASWGVIALTWLVFPPIVPVAIGQFAIVALTSTETGLLEVLPVEVTILALLIADLVDGNGWWRNEVSTLSWPDTPFTFSDIALALSMITLFGAGLELIATETSTLTAGLLGLALFGTISYALHRYSLIDLGYVE